MEGTFTSACNEGNRYFEKSVALVLSFSEDFFLEFKRTNARCWLAHFNTPDGIPIPMTS